LIGKGFRVGCGYQVYGGPTESASGHAPAVVAGEAFGKFDHDIEFAATDLVQVAKTAVRLPHQLSETIEISGAETASAVAHTLIFLDHMTAALKDFIGEIFRVLQQLIDGEIAQRSDIGIPLRENFHTFLTLFAALIVFSAGVLVLDHGVTDRHSHSVGNGDELELERTAVEQEGVASFSQAGDKLVHDADMGADKNIFASLAEPGHIDQGKDCASAAEERESARDFDGGRGTQSSADRNFAIDEKICALQNVSGLLQDHGDPENIVTPISDAVFGKSIQVKCKMSGKLLGSDNQSAILPRRDGHAGTKTDGTGHNKTVVVIGVFAD
jgi:hypothetical protein